MKDISLEIELKRGVDEDWQFANLTDASLSFEIVGVLMNEDKGGTYSYPFKLDVEENQHIFGSSAELRGESIYKVLHDARCRLAVGGLPVAQGKISLDDEVDIEVNSTTGHHEVEVKMVSQNKSYEDIINDAKLRDINLSQYNIQIGYCLPEEMDFQAKFRRTKYELKLGAQQIGLGIEIDGKYYYVDEDTAVVEHKTVIRSIALPKFMFPVYNHQNHDGSVYNFNGVNVSSPYDPTNPLAHPYCNTRICFNKYVAGDDKWEQERGYTIKEADSINSAPCFYLGFVFDIAMREMGIPVTSNALNNIMDYKRMAFWHADARYDVVHYMGSFCSNAELNKFTISAGYRSGRQYGYNTWYTAMEGGTHYRYHYEWKNEGGEDTTKTVQCYFPLCKAIANADNLPDIGVKDLLSNITSAFGARIIYDSFMGSMDIVLLRDVMRDTKNAIVIPCEIVEEPVKTENDNRGFRLKYSGANTQSYNTITKAKNDSEGSDATSYNYFGYKNVQHLKAGEEYTSYQDLVMGVSCYDMNLYVDDVTGNMFRIKVDSDAKNPGEYHPSTFEVAGYRNVELGDCSDDDYVKEVSIPFAPVISSMTNQMDMRTAQMSGNEIPSPIYAQYVEGEIHQYTTGELVESNYVYNDIPLDVITQSDGKTVHGCHIDIDLNIQATEGWAENVTDAPYFDKECENVLGIMRGSGSDASMVIYNQDFDGFGTAKYAITAGSDSEFFSDSVNHMGQLFDYNGDATGLGYDPDQVISLKLKAEKPKDGDETKGEYYPVNSTFQKRGLWDKFYVDWAHFWLDHHIANINVRIELASLSQIIRDTTKWYTFGEFTGLIKSGTASLNEDGTVNLKLKLAYL